MVAGRRNARGGFGYLEAVGVVVALVVAILMVRLGISWNGVEVEGSQGWVDAGGGSGRQSRD